MKQRILHSLVFLFTSLIAVSIYAQDGQCDLPVDAAICGDLAADQVCFVQEQVEVLVDCELDPTFDTPGEQLSMDEICLVRTIQSGAALIQMEPNGNPVYLAPVGDVEIQSVSDGTVGTRVTLNEATDIYAGPGSQYDRVGSLEADTEIFVNACNCTRNWLRVMQNNGSVGWIPARLVDLDRDSLPQVDPDAPVYENMQAMTLISGATCSGVLIQTVDDPVLLQINGAEMELDATAFVRAQNGDTMEIYVLGGQASVTANDMTMVTPMGGRVIVPLTEQSIPTGSMRVDLYTPEQVAAAALGLVPTAVDPVIGLETREPVIVGVEECNVVSDLGEVPCPVHFLNPDGDDIVSMDVEFVYAPFGEWEGSTHESLELLDGNMTAGILGWDVSCSLAGENFIGDVEWLITLEDVRGHRSAPFTATFNCIDG